MLLNYVRIAIRNLTKYKAFSFINIVGMAVSLSSCLLITLFVWDELAYDRHHPDGDRTYRIYNTVIREGGNSDLPIVPYPFASYMQKDFPEVESTLRMMDTYGDILFEVGDKKLMESGGLFAEPTVFDMLTIDVISGHADSALVRPGTVALSESLAKKYFGETNPVGQTFKMNNNVNEITAVYADPPEQFHLNPRFLVSFASTGWDKIMENNWQRQQLFTYLKLKPGSDAAGLEAKFLPFVEKYAHPTISKAGMTYSPHLQNIKDIHLNSSGFDWEIAKRGDAQSVYILIATAVMILLIASLNFINLSTARSVKRMKEVGVRKVAGAQRHQLVVQFIAESVLITMLAMTIAIVLAEVAMPYLNQVVEKNLSISFGPAYLLGGLIACLALGTLAGSYPALLLSGFKPAVVLVGKQQRGSGVVFRQGLVVVQFMLSFFLIAGSSIVYYQNEMVQTHDLGFNKDQLLIVPLRGPLLRNTETSRLLFMNHPNVLNVTIGFGLPGDIIAGDGVIDPATKTELATSLICVDYDYINTLGMHVIAGREFSKDFPTDSIEAFIVNEAFIKTYNLGDAEKALGKELDWGRWDGRGVKQGRIIGVVQDFHFKSLREKVTPVVLHVFPGASWKMAARIKSENIDETIAHFRKTYEANDPEWAFSYSFLDQNFEAMYKTEQKLGALFSMFTYLAIAVACLGLFGLVEYSVNQRTKEVSIRKVLGADTSTLVLLLTRRYFILLIVAIALVVPVLYYAADDWLSNFAYHIDVEPMIFIKAALIVIGVTAATVSYQSLKAALANPAKNLRND